MAGPQRPGPPRQSSHHLSAIARSDALLLGVGERRLLVYFGEHVAVRLDPVGNELPVLAVPLLDADTAVAFVVRAGELDRHHQPIGAQLGNALPRDVEVLVAPLHLLAFERLLAELALRGTDRLEIEDRIDDAAVVEHLADLIPCGVAAILVIDVFEDVLYHAVILSRAVE